MHAFSQGLERSSSGATFLTVSRTIILLGIQAGALAGLLPCLNLAPCTLTFGFELVVASTEFGNGLLSKKLL
jgi:hypothetical protein